MTHKATALAGSILALAATLQLVPAAAQTQPAKAAKLTILYSFASTGNDGMSPRGGVIRDDQGALYGTTVSGGPPDICPATSQGCGTVYRLTPPIDPRRQWKETILYNFGTRDGDGNGPYGGVIAGEDGALYGTMSSFGPTVMYKLRPPVAPRKVWIETQLFVAKLSDDPASSFDGLIADADGALYGTTSQGGAHAGGNCSNFGCGTVFKLTPPIRPKAAWTLTVLYSFAGGLDGKGPAAALVADKDQAGTITALYGTTGAGGGGNCLSGGGCGTVFRLAAPVAPKNVWKETLLHSFAGGSDGSDPNNSLIIVNGALYGMTSSGGDSNLGTVFELTPPAPDKHQWKNTVLHSFAGGNDGVGPAWPGHLLAGPNGVLYGMAAGNFSTSFGTVFRLTPPVAPDKSWTETVLHDFTDTPDGAGPRGTLVADQDGALYGATAGGGVSGRGSVFKLVVP